MLLTNIFCAIFFVSSLMKSNAENYRTVEVISVHGPIGYPEVSKIAPKGEMGRQGIPGLNGCKGVKGEIGKHGPKGKEGHYIIKTRELGTNTDSRICDFPDSEDRDVFKNCKFVSEDYETGKYCISPIDSVILAKCDTLSTCIGANVINSSYITLHSTKYTENKQFWLSEKGTVLTNNIPMDALYGLQIQSSYVTQVIVIHCRNSFVYFNGKNYDNAVQLLMWNDVLIGPYPTETSPIYFTVQSSLDGCKENINDGTWRQTQIELRSSYTFRLPIKDVLVRDIEGESKEIFVEFKDLCFK